MQMKAHLPHLGRRAMLLGLGAASLAGPAFAQLSDDITIGSASARLHLTEYGSLSCPYCAQFHAQNWPALKSQYIDTGRVRFTFREMATAPAPVAVGMFQLARCETTDPNEYLRRVGVLFERQRAILSSGSMVGVRDALIAAGLEFGVLPAQVMACLTDPAGAERVQRSAAAAQAAGVDHTPGFLFDGVFDDDHAFMTPDGMVRILEAKLAAAR